MAGYRVMGITSAVVLAVLPAVAGAAEEGGGMQTGHWINAVATVVIFLLLLVVLRAFAWKPLLESLQQRERSIREDLDSAAAEREKAEKMLADYEQRLSDVQQQVEQMLRDGRDQADQTSRQLLEEARDQAQKIKDQARVEITSAKDEAVRELYERVADISTLVASRILERELTPEDHRTLIERSLEQIRRTNGQGNEN